MTLYERFMFKDDNRLLPRIWNSSFPFQVGAWKLTVRLVAALIAEKDNIYSYKSMFVLKQSISCNFLGKKIEKYNNY